MVHSPVFEPRPAERPDPQRYLLKREGSPAGVDAAARRASAGAPASPKAASSVGSKPESPNPKKHASTLFWRLYERCAVSLGSREQSYVSLYVPLVDSQLLHRSLWPHSPASPWCTAVMLPPSPRTFAVTPLTPRCPHPHHPPGCRGELPVLVDQARPGKNGIRWKAELEQIDLHYYLPVFLDGIVETQVGGAGRQVQVEARAGSGCVEACAWHYGPVKRGCSLIP